MDQDTEYEHYDDGQIQFSYKRGDRLLLEEEYCGRVGEEPGEDKEFEVDNEEEDLRLPHIINFFSNCIFIEKFKQKRRKRRRRRYAVKTSDEDSFEEVGDTDSSNDNCESSNDNCAKTSDEECSGVVDDPESSNDNCESSNDNCAKTSDEESVIAKI
jgi:hypothetical protein